LHNINIAPHCFVPTVS